MRIWFPEGKRIYELLSALLIGSFLLSPASIAKAAETEILILHTNNVTGYLLPCPT